MSEMSVPDAVHYGVAKEIMRDFYDWFADNNENPLLRKVIYGYATQYLIDKHQRLSTKARNEK